MQFCRSCNNLLYPREDKVAKKLVFACVQCRYEQEADNPVVFRHEVVKSVRCVACWGCGCIGALVRGRGGAFAAEGLTVRSPRGVLTSPSPSTPCSNQLEKIPDGIISDPTLGREASEVCPKCSHSGAVFIMPKITPADNRIKLIFVCTNVRCVHKWQST